MRPRRFSEPSIASWAGARATALALATFLSVIASATPSTAQTPSPGSLAARIEALVTQAKLPPQLGLSIVDLETGRSVLAINAQTPLNPASNLKLITAAAALHVLGPDFRMQTGLYGQVRQERTDGLCLKGQADPTLTRAH